MLSLLSDGKASVRSGEFYMVLLHIFSLSLARCARYIVEFVSGLRFFGLAWSLESINIRQSYMHSEYK